MLTALTAWLGGWDIALQLLVAVVCVDIATGILKGYATRTLSSAVTRRGLSRKVGIFVAVAIAGLVDRVTGTAEPIIRTAVIYWFIVAELLSATENLAAAGVPIPAPLSAALAQLRQQHGDGGAA